VRVAHVSTPEAIADDVTPPGAPRYLERMPALAALCRHRERAGAGVQHAPVFQLAPWTREKAAHGNLFRR